MNEGSEEKGGKKKVGEGCREVEERFWWRNGVFVMQGSTSFTSETSLPITATTLAFVPISKTGEGV